MAQKGYLSSSEDEVNNEHESGSEYERGPSRYRKRHSRKGNRVNFNDSNTTIYKPAVTPASDFQGSDEQVYTSNETIELDLSASLLESPDSHFQLTPNQRYPYSISDDRYGGDWTERNPHQQGRNSQSRTLHQNMTDQQGLQMGLDAIRQAEASKARIYDVSGNNENRFPFNHTE